MGRFKRLVLLVALSSAVACSNEAGGDAGLDAQNDTDGQQISADAEDGADAGADILADTDGADTVTATDAQLDAPTSADSAADVEPDGAEVADAAFDVSVPSGKCTAEVDCKGSGEFCLAPGAFGGCGMCWKPTETCATDAECAAVEPGNICIWRPQSCACGGETTCQPGCETDAACAAGEVCDAQLRCVAKPCDNDLSCPAQFECVAGACARRACAASSTCAVGFCVTGACFDEPGTCDLPKP